MNISTILNSEVMNTILTMIVIPAVVVLGNQLNKLIQEKIKSEKLQKYLNIANECVTDSVIAVAQTYVDKLKDEEWNDETKSEAFIQARERVLQNLGISGKEIITEAMGDFDKWLETKIEAEVKRLENNTPTTLTVLDAVKSEVSK